LPALLLKIGQQIVPYPEEFPAVVTSDPGFRLGVVRNSQPDSQAVRAFETMVEILLAHGQGECTGQGIPARWAVLGRCITGVTFHDLRGTFITERHREGSSIEKIGLISGHSITEIKLVLERHYLAHDQEGSDAVIERMEKNLS
jgi:hypothetical protein